LTAADYERLTSQPRPLLNESRRVESARAAKQITHRIKLSDRGGEAGGKRWTYDPNRLKRYDERAIPAKTEHIPRLLKHEPCFLAFVDDPEVYETETGERVELEDVDTSPHDTVIVLDGEYVVDDARADF